MTGSIERGLNKLIIFTHTLSETLFELRNFRSSVANAFPHRVNFCVATLPTNGDQAFACVHFLYCGRRSLVAATIAPLTRLLVPQRTVASVTHIHNEPTRSFLVRMCCGRPMS